jgi:hypothetical protein
MSDHNTITKAFVHSLRPLLTKPQAPAEVMVVYESVTMAIMLLLTEIYRMKPDAAAEYVEVALQEATRRFAAENNKEKKQ